MQYHKNRICRNMLYLFKNHQVDTIVWSKTNCVPTGNGCYFWSGTYVVSFLLLEYLISILGNITLKYVWTQLKANTKCILKIPTSKTNWDTHMLHDTLFLTYHYCYCQKHAEVSIQNCQNSAIALRSFYLIFSTKVVTRRNKMKKMSKQNYYNYENFNFPDT